MAAPVRSSPSELAASFSTASIARSSASPAPGTIPLGHRRLRRADRVFEGLPAALQLRLRRRADADDRDAAGELPETLLQLLAVVVALRLVHRTAEVLHAVCDRLLLALAADDRRGLAPDDDAPRPPKIGEREVLELHAELLGHDAPAGEDGEVLEQLLPPLAESGRLHGSAGQRAADLVHDERRERLALHVLGDDEERPPRLHDLLEDGEEVLHGSDAPVGEQQERVLHHALHPVRVRHEVGGQVPTVELHPLDHLQLRLRPLRLLDRDDALAPHPLLGEPPKRTGEPTR
jgi:hypothetical protein